MPILLDPNKVGPIDVTDPNNLNPTKILPEYEYRKRLLAMAREFGIEYDMLRIFDKYDRMMRNCPNEDERKDMAKLGILSIHNLLSRGKQLYVNNELVADDKDGK